MSVLVRNQKTDFNYNADTTQEGIYRVLYLNLGSYEIAFEAAGFKKLARKDIPIRSTEEVRLDATVEVGTVVESVELSAVAPSLETETATTGQLLTGAELTALPTPQMKIENMLWCGSGVTSPSGNGHSAGGRSRAFLMTIDEVGATNPGVGTVATAHQVTTVEHDMQEVKILTTARPSN